MQWKRKYDDKMKFFLSNGKFTSKHKNPHWDTLFTETVMHFFILKPCFCQN